MFVHFLFVSDLLFNLFRIDCLVAICWERDVPLAFHCCFYLSAFLIVVPLGQDVQFDCTSSWSLPFYLLLFTGLCLCWCLCFPLSYIVRLWTLIVGIPAQFHWLWDYCQWNGQEFACIISTRGPWAAMLTWVNSYKSLVQHFRLPVAMAANKNEEFVHLLYAWWSITQHT